MQTHRVSVVKRSDNSSRCRVSRDLQKLFGIRPGKTKHVRLSFGLGSTKSAVTVDSSLSPQTLVVSKSVASELRLPLPLELSLHRLSRRHIRIGPFLGILISRDKLASLQSGSVDSIYLRYAQHAAEDGICLCFFTVADIREKQNRVTAYQFGPTGLQRLRTPLPQVIYDRCFGPDGREEAGWARRLATRNGMTVLNWPIKLTKLATYEALQSDPDLRDVVPYAESLTVESLQKAASRFPFLYVKPDNLARGQGVCRVWQQDASWISEESGQGWHERHVHRTAAELIDHLPTEHKYLLQEGIDLATYLGNKYDMRSLVQKDDAGQWRLTGLVARVAPALGVITSPRSGGLITDAALAMEQSFGPAGGRAALRAVTDVSLRIADKIEHSFGPCVELGIDLGVTQDGQVKLIEVNGRPLKVSLLRLNDPAVAQRVYRYPLRYAATQDLTGGVSAR